MATASERCRHTADRQFRACQPRPELSSRSPTSAAPRRRRSPLGMLEQRASCTPAIGSRPRKQTYRASARAPRRSRALRTPHQLPRPAPRTPRPAMFNPPPFNPAEPWETLAENTFEALRVVRQGEWVYKFLKSPKSVTLARPGGGQRELYLRVLESHCHPELNPMWFSAKLKCIVSRYVAGRLATTKEATALLDRFARTGRGYIKDCGPNNVRIIDERAVVIDFVLAEENHDWRRRRASMHFLLSCRVQRHPSTTHHFFPPSSPNQSKDI